MSKIHTRSLFILMVCSAGSVWAQDTLTLDSNSDAWRTPSLEQSVCPDHPNPPAVDDAVDSCIDRLVKTDVQELPGICLNPAALPADDSERFGHPEVKLPAVRPPPTSATSWIPRSTSTLVETFSADPDPASLRAVTSPIMPHPADTADTSPTEAADFKPATAPEFTLSRRRLRAQQQRAHRRSLEVQQSFHQQCQQLHLSDVECRLRQQEQKAIAPINRTNRPAISSRQQPVP